MHDVCPRYASSCRVILCCESSSRIIEPLKSRCLCVRVPAFSDKEVIEALEGVALAESFAVPKILVAQIAARAKGNLRRALIMLETSKVRGRLLLPDWEQCVSSLVTDVFAEQTPRQLLTVRRKLYKLLCNCVPASAILKVRENAMRRRVSMRSDDALLSCDAMITFRRYAWTSFSGLRMTR